MTRAAYSFFAAFLGWLLPFLGYLAWMQFGTGFGYITDFRFLLFWPLLFAFLGWLLVALPLVLILDPARFYSLYATVAIAVASTTLVFLVIATFFRFGPLYFSWWPILIGLIGGVTFWLLHRFQPGRPWVFWTVPMIFFPFLRFVLIPVGIAFFPYTTHVLAEGTVFGDDAYYAVISRINVGDSFQNLHSRYPQIFREPVLAIFSSSGDGRSYTISFDESCQRVTEIMINSKRHETGHE